jgi:hypothetical protein
VNFGMDLPFLLLLFNIPEQERFHGPFISRGSPDFTQLLEQFHNS